MGDGYLTIPEFVQALRDRGLSFHERTIRLWIKAGRIKAIKPGLRQWYIPREEVDRVLKGGEGSGASRVTLVAAAC